MDVMVHICKTSIQRWRQEDFKVTLGNGLHDKSERIFRNLRRCLERGREGRKEGGERDWWGMSLCMILIYISLIG